MSGCAITPGLLTVTLSPANAAAAGAKWHVNGGAAQSDGASVSLAPGSYTVTFDPLTGWAAPASQTVSVLRAQTTVASGIYTPPVGLPGIYSVQPSVGALAGGTPMTIQGVNFTPASTVTIGGNPAPNVTFVSDSQLTCLTPASTVYGTAPVVVQTSGGTATSANGFAYGLPRGNGIQLAGSIGGYVNATAAQGNYGYVGEGSTFTVLDVSNLAAPSPVGRLEMPGLVQDIALFSNAGHQYAAVANDDAGLQIVDITTPSAPALRGCYSASGGAYGITILGTHAYVGDGYSGLMVFDISNPAQPQLVGSAPTGDGSTSSGGFANRLVVQSAGSGLLAYIVSSGALYILDVSNPSNPIPLGHTAQLLTQWSQPNSLAVSGNRAFLCDGYGYMQAVDISNPSVPTALGAVSSDSPEAVSIASGLIYTWDSLGLQIYSFPGGPAQRIGYTYVSGQLAGNSIAVLGGKALCSGGEMGLYLYDVSTSSNPVYRGTYGATSGYFNMAAVNGTTVYAATENNGLKIFDASGPANPVFQSQYVSALNSGFGGEEIQAYGNRAYYISAHQLNMLDVSNPSAPQLLGTSSTSQFLIDDFYVLGNSVLVAGSDTTSAPSKPAVAVLSISIPASISTPEILDLSTLAGGAAAIACNGSVACVDVPTASGSDSLAVIDFSNPANLQQVGQLTNIGTVPIGSMRFAPDNRYLFVGGEYSDHSWKIIDLATSSAPVRVSATNVGAAVFGFDFAGSTAYLATGKGVLVYDFSDPSHPELLRSYSTPTGASSIKVSGSKLYVTDGRGGLTVLSLSDTNAPAVAIISPTAASTWSNSTGTLNLSGTAGDTSGLVQGTVSNVTWANSQGGGGNVTGTNNWSINGVILQPGQNLLTVTATDSSGNSGSATLTVNYQVPVQNQTITFPAIADHTFGDAPIPLVASASSGLVVQFTVISGPATASNNMLTLTGAGAISVEASQPGNGAFNPATPVDVSFNVAKADQSITFTPVPNQSAGGPAFALTATSSSGLPVYFNIVSGPSVLSSNVVTLLGAGAVVVNAWQPGNSNYNGAATVQQSFAVSGVPQTITFGPLSNQQVGDAPFGLNATSDSGLPITYSVVSGPAIISGSTLIITGPGTVTIAASQSGDGIYDPASDVEQSFSVLSAPGFTSHPANLGVTAGSNVSFTAIAAGNPAPTYQWQLSTDGGRTWTDVPGGLPYSGKATSSLTVTGVTTAMNGYQYRCVASNGASPDATSFVATLTVMGLSDQAFLQNLFLDVLGRQIDSGAAATFGDALAGGKSRAAVLGDLMSSAEYNTWQVEPAIRLYYAALARMPDYAGLHNWVNALHAGGLALKGAAEQFAGSAEFNLKYGSLDNAGYVRQLYRNVLGREADPTGLTDWVNQLNGGATRGAILVGFSESLEFQTDMANQVEIIRLYDLLLKRMPTTTELQSWQGSLLGYDQTDTLFEIEHPAPMANSDYVQLVFQGFLRRPADTGALSSFGNALTAGTVTHASLVNTLFTSTEFNTFVGPVSRLYMAAFHRVPDVGGLDNWVNYVRAGNPLQSAADQFVASPEFQLTYGSLNDTQYVTLLYENVLGREPDSAGLQDWVNRLGTGYTRGQVLIGFSESPEGIALFAPTVRTFLHYFTFLNATPAQSDLDYWKNYLTTLDDQMRDDLLADPAFTN